MKLSEIRIGNYVKVSKTEIKFTAFDYSINEDLINPIPLTEEWLFKLGARYEADGEIYISYFNLHIQERGVWVGAEGCCQTEQIAILNYVHQLQNLYFALTGEELTTTKNEKDFSNCTH